MIGHSVRHTGYTPERRFARRLDQALGIADCVREAAAERPPAFAARIAAGAGRIERRPEPLDPDGLRALTEVRDAATVHQPLFTRKRDRSSGRQPFQLRKQSRSNIGAKAFQALSNDKRYRLIE